MESKPTPRASIGHNGSDVWRNREHLVEQRILDALKANRIRRTQVRRRHSERQTRLDTCPSVVELDRHHRSETHARP
jgi:hypothetical protein